MFAIDSIRDRLRFNYKKSYIEFQCNSFYAYFCDEFSIKTPLSCLYADLANFQGKLLGLFLEQQLEVQVSMLDDSFCCLRSLIFGAKIGMEFPNIAYQVLWFGCGATHAH